MLQSFFPRYRTYIKFVKLFLGCIFISLLTQAQTDAIGNFNKHIIEKWTHEYIRIGQYKVKGTPYLLGESFPGNITYMNGGTVMEVNILYDIYKQEAGVDIDGQMMETDKDVKEFMLVFPEKFGGGKLLFRSSAYFGQPELKTYFNVLYDEGEKVALLKVYKSKLIGDPANLYSKELKIFEQYYEYFLFDKNAKTFNKIKLREKEILKQLNDSGKLKNYVKAHSLDLTKEKDVIALITEHNLGVAINQ